MSKFGAFLGCSLTYGLSVETNFDPSIPYLVVENSDRRLLSPRYVYSINENFQVRSAHREVAIFAKESDRIRFFYVNSEDLLELAPGLIKRLHKIRRSSRTGRIISLGDIQVGVAEFEAMLKLIFDSCSFEERDELLDLHLPQLLLLARRFKIRSLGEECHQHVINADYTKLSYKTVRSWLEGFNRTDRFGVDKTISLMLSEKLLLILGREVNQRLKKLSQTSNSNCESEGSRNTVEAIRKVHGTSDDTKRNR